VFFGQERHDPGWKQGYIGWLLRLVPLPLGAAVHDHFRESVETGLSWLAERFIRHELRRVVTPAIASLPCSEGVQERLQDGVDAFARARWSTASTLLTTGLEGLLFDLAIGRSVLTRQNKVIRPGRPPGNTVKTASDSRVLAGLGFDQSQQLYLSGLSLGKGGRKPRHGQDPEVGPERQAAAALLGLILVAIHLDIEQRALARVLLGP
jgi:hypothetical protein